MSSLLLALIITNVAGGSYTSTTTWAGSSVPTFADESVITGHVVTVDGTAQCATSTIVNAASKLVINGTLQISNLFRRTSGTISNFGTLTLLGAANVTAIINDVGTMDATGVAGGTLSANTTYSYIQGPNSGRTLNFGNTLVTRGLALNGGTVSGSSGTTLIASNANAFAANGGFYSAFGVFYLIASNLDTFVIATNVQFVAGSQFNLRAVVKPCTFSFEGSVVSNLIGAAGRLMVDGSGTSATNVTLYLPPGGKYWSDGGRLQVDYLGSLTATNMEIAVGGSVSCLILGGTSVKSICDVRGSTISFTASATTVEGGVSMLASNSTLFAKNLAIQSNGGKWGNVTSIFTGNAGLTINDDFAADSLTLSNTTSSASTTAINTKGFNVSIGTLTLQAQQPLNGSNSTFTISDAWTVNKGTFTPQSSTVTLGINASPVVLSNVGTFNNLTMATAGKSLTIISNIVVTSTASFSASGAAPGIISGSPCLLTLSNAGTAFGYGLSNIGVAAYRPLYTWGGVTDRKTATGNVQQVGRYQIIQ